MIREIVIKQTFGSCFPLGLQILFNLNDYFQMVVFGERRHEPAWAMIVIMLSHLLLAISSAINILIYSYKVYEYIICAIIKTLF